MANKLIAFGITAMIVASLVIAGNVQAFDVQITPEEKSTAGNKLNFQADFSDVGEINSLTLTAGNVSCTFDEEGNALAPCDGIEVKKLTENQNDFGYGYGTSKDVKYKITLDRDAFAEGSHTLVLTANTDDGNGSDSSTFEIKARGKSSSAPGKNK